MNGAATFVGDELARGSALPVPPRELRAITACPEEELFLSGGLANATLFAALFEKHAGAHPAKVRALDLGCGCGRLSRYLGWRYELFGCDLNPDHVAWCWEHLPNVTTLQNGKNPPLPFAPGSFGFAYALSVVTHLSEANALGWIADLARVLKPGGIAIVTTHGYPCLATLAASREKRDYLAFSEATVRDIRLALPREGWVYVPYPPEVVKAANVGIDYGLSFTNPTHADATWGHFFEIVEHIAGALDGWQDAFVLRRR